MKQETLEEAKIRIYKDNWNIEHTQWIKSTFLNGFEKGAKWQQERMYSEEEVKQMLIECCGEVSCEDGVLMGKTPVELFKWIDQKFKKK